MFGIRSALFIWVLIRLGPDPEYSIYGKLSLWEIIRWDLIPLGNYPCTMVIPDISNMTRTVPINPV